MKQRKLITLSPEIIDDIEWKSKEENFNFSEWVEDNWIDYNMTEKGIKLQIQFHKKRIETLKKQGQRLKRNHEIWGQGLKRNLTEKMRKEIQYTKKIIEKDPKKIIARLNFINNSFNCKLSKQDLLNLIEEKSKDL